MHYLYKKDSMDPKNPRLPRREPQPLSELTRITDNIMKAHGEMLDRQK